MEAKKWVHMTAKIALAVAIIRNKPDAKTSREYAEEMAQRIANQDVKMKSKVQELEAEVLSLRQELLLHKIHGKSNFNNEPITSAFEPVEDSGSVGQLLNDSGCDISNEDGVDALTASQSSNNCDQLFTSLSSSASPSNLLPIKNSITFGEGQLSSQINFLNHLLGVRKLTASGNYPTDLTMFENDCSVIAESLFALLKGLFSLYENPKPSGPTLQAEAIRTVTNLLTKSRQSKNIHQECIKRLKDFEKNVIQSILINSSINRFQVQQAKVDCLHELGRCSELYGPLINLLFYEIKNFVDELLQLQGKGNYDITKYENISLLCFLLENLLQQLKDQPMLGSETFDDETKQLVLNLHHTILQISDDFPLLSVTLWRLLTLFPS